MTEQTKKECIKALAYGHSAETVAMVTGFPVDTVKEIQEKYARDIENKVSELKEAGYIE